VLRRHPAIEGVTIPTAHPFVPHIRGKLRPTSKLRRVKRNTAKLGGESSLRPLKMNFLVLVVQLIVMSKNIYSGMTSARSNNLDKFANLNNSIQHQLMQLYSEFAQNIHKNWMRWHVKPSNKKILEHRSFVHSRIRNRFCTRRSVISFQKIAGVTL
jgi:hypothetical protein